MLLMSIEFFLKLERRFLLLIILLPILIASFSIIGFFAGLYIINGDFNIGDNILDLLFPLSLSILNFIIAIILSWFVIRRMINK